MCLLVINQFEHLNANCTYALEKDRHIDRVSRKTQHNFVNDETTLAAVLRKLFIIESKLRNNPKISDGRRNGAQKRFTDCDKKKLLHFEISTGSYQDYVQLMISGLNHQGETLFQINRAEMRSLAGLTMTYSTQMPFPDAVAQTTRSERKCNQTVFLSITHQADTFNQNINK